MAVKRGEIYWVQFDPVKGNEQGGSRPALVVQNDVGNRFSPTTVVVAITRTIPPQPYPFIVSIFGRKCSACFRVSAAFIFGQSAARDVEHTPDNFSSGWQNSSDCVGRFI